MGFKENDDILNTGQIIESFLKTTDSFQKNILTANIMYNYLRHVKVFSSLIYFLFFGGGPFKFSSSITCVMCEEEHSDRMTF